MKKYFFASLAAILMGGGLAHADTTISILGGPTWDPGLTIGSKQDMDSGYNFGARVGYGLDAYGLQNFSLEADSFYDESRLSNVTGQHVRSLSGMGDLVYHLNLNMPFRFYGGAGLGVVNTEYGDNGAAGSSSVLGWQALGGVEYPISADTDLFAEYRYLNAHDVNIGSNLVGNTSNSLSFGVKLHL